MSMTPAVFFSYTRADDKREDGKLSQIRKALETELCALSGDDWTVFQDSEHIEIGEKWRKRLAEGLSGSTFFLPILTPTYLKRAVCRDELTQFLAKERELGRDDLVFPVLYLETPLLTDKHLRESDQLAVELAARNWADWRELRDYKVKTTKVRRKIRGLAEAILAASNRTPVPVRQLALPAKTPTLITSVPVPPLSERWQERIRSIVTVAWSVVPFTEMVSEWLCEIQVHGLRNYPALMFGPKATDIIEELYSRVRKQEHPTTAIDWEPVLDPFRKELRSLEAAGFLKGRHTVTADFGKGLRLSNAGFMIDLALLCDDPVKSVKLNETVESAKEGLKGEELSGSLGLPLIVVNAFFQIYEQKGQGNASKTIGKSYYAPHGTV